MSYFQNKSLTLDCMLWHLRELKLSLRFRCYSNLVFLHSKVTILKLANNINNNNNILSLECILLFANSRFGMLKVNIPFCAIDISTLKRHYFFYSTLTKIIYGLLLGVSWTLMHYKIRRSSVFSAHLITHWHLTIDSCGLHYHSYCGNKL